MSWKREIDYIVPKIILTPIVLYCLAFTKEGRNTALRGHQCNKVISRVWDFSIVEKIQNIIPDLTYEQLTPLEKVNFLVLRIIRRLTGLYPPVEVQFTGTEDLTLLKKSNDPIVVALTHNDIRLFLRKILNELNDKKCYLIAYDPDAVSEILQIRALPALGQLEIIKQDKSCLTTLAKRLSKGSVALCAVDYRSEGSTSCDEISHALFVFAEQLRLAVYFTKLIATRGGEFTVEFKRSDAFRDARQQAKDYVDFLLPERKFRLRDR